MSGLPSLLKSPTTDATGATPVVGHATDGSPMRTHGATVMPPSPLLPSPLLPSPRPPSPVGSSSPLVLIAALPHPKPKRTNTTQEESFDMSPRSCAAEISRYWHRDNKQNGDSRTRSKDQTQRVVIESQ